MSGKRRYLGLDPGLNGGIASVNEDGVGFVMPMPKTREGVWQVLTDLRADTLTADGSPQISAVAEFVSASPQMGVSSSFTFGRGYERLLMALTAAGIPFVEIVPRKWQPVVGVVYPKGSTYTERKNISKQRAQELFPGFADAITHSVADALLIAEACRRLALTPPAPPVSKTRTTRRRAQPLLDGPATDAVARAGGS